VSIEYIAVYDAGFHAGETTRATTGGANAASRGYGTGVSGKCTFSSLALLAAKASHCSKRH